MLQARFPFLDENVIKTLLEIPLWDIAKLDEPVGKGDKKILREVCACSELSPYGGCYIKLKFAFEIHI
jgi:asparagine synthetase B (glutamine-hydrolysing)